MNVFKLKRWQCAVALFAVACSGDGSDVAGIPMLRVEVQVDANIAIGESSALTAVVYDRDNKPRDGANVVWKSSAPLVAQVSNGRLLALTEGTATISATTEGMTGEAAVTVVNVDDVAILDARMTQGVQEPDQSIPLIRDGLPAVLNVVLRPRHRPVTRSQFVLRLLKASGDVVHTDTLTYGNPVGDLGFLLPSLQFLVPSEKLGTGLYWQVVRDPRRVAPDDSAHNDVFPRNGPRPMPTTTVPTLSLHFVPVRLGADDNITPDITEATIESYVRDVRRMMPMGKINVTIGPVLTTSVKFGVPPVGGDDVFWSRLLSQLDAARLASGANRSKHWIGFVQRPPGYTKQEFGGYGYRPSALAGDGPATRTSAVTVVGSSQNPFTRLTIAHELGHNFGRGHAPCGNPAVTDYNFPTVNGVIEEIGHDVYSWYAGLTSRAMALPKTTGDIMGYCPEVWSSVYTYRNVMSFRASAASVVAERVVANGETTRRESLVLRGVVNTRDITLFPPHVLEMPVIESERGAGTLELLDTARRVVHIQRFAVTELPETGDFAFLIVARDHSRGSQVARIRIDGMTREFQLQPGDAAACSDSGSEAALQDATGRIMGFITPSRAQGAPSGAISCSRIPARVR